MGDQELSHVADASIPVESVLARVAGERFPDGPGIVKLLHQLFGGVRGQRAGLGISEIPHAFGAGVESAVGQEIQPFAGSERVAIKKSLAGLDIPELEPACRARRNQVFTVWSKTD